MINVNLGRGTTECFLVGQLDEAVKP